MLNNPQQQHNNSPCRTIRLPQRIIAPNLVVLVHITDVRYYAPVIRTWKLRCLVVVCPLLVVQVHLHFNRSLFDEVNENSVITPFLAETKRISTPFNITWYRRHVRVRRTASSRAVRSFPGRDARRRPATRRARR